MRTRQTAIMHRYQVKTLNSGKPTPLLCAKFTGDLHDLPAALRDKWYWCGHGTEKQRFVYDSDKSVYYLETEGKRRKRLREGHWVCLGPNETLYILTDKQLHKHYERTLTPTARWYHKRPLHIAAFQYRDCLEEAEYPDWFRMAMKVSSSENNSAWIADGKCYIRSADEVKEVHDGDYVLISWHGNLQVWDEEIFTQTYMAKSPLPGEDVIIYLDESVPESSFPVEWDPYGRKWVATKGKSNK